jgi:hypothetical protein
LLKVEFQYQEQSHRSPSEMSRLCHSVDIAMIEVLDPVSRLCFQKLRYLSWRTNTHMEKWGRWAFPSNV